MCGSTPNKTDLMDRSRLNPVYGRKRRNSCGPAERFTGRYARGETEGSAPAGHAKPSARYRPAISEQVSSLPCRSDACLAFRKPLWHKHSQHFLYLLLQLRGPMLSEDCDETLYHTRGSSSCGA